MSSYQEYPKEITSIFASFEIAAQSYVRNYDKVSEKTSTKRLDVARREAFSAIVEYAKNKQIEEINHWLGLVTWPNTYLAMEKAMKERIKELNS